MLSSFRTPSTGLRSVSRKLFQAKPKDEKTDGNIECELLKVAPSQEINIKTLRGLTTANAVYVIQNNYERESKQKKEKNRKLYYIHFDRGICELVAKNISDEDAVAMNISGAREKQPLKYDDLEKIEKIVNADGKRSLALRYIALDKKLQDEELNEQKNSVIPESERDAEPENASLSGEEKAAKLKETSTAFYTPAPWARAAGGKSTATPPYLDLAESKKKISGNIMGLNEIIASLNEENIKLKNDFAEKIAELTQENTKLKDNFENKQKESNIVEKQLNHKIEELIVTNEKLTATNEQLAANHKNATDWINTFEIKIQKAHNDSAEKNKEIQRLNDELTKLTVQTASVLAHSSTSETDANMTPIQLTESSSVEVNLIGDLDKKIKNLTIASTGDQQQAFAEALRHLHNLLQVEPDKKLADEFAAHTSTFIDAFQAGDKQAKLNALSDYEKNCVNLSGWEKFKVALATVISAAAGVILGVAIEIGVCATIGFFVGGPAGGAVGVIAGLFSGSFSALGIGLAGGAVGAGIAGGILGGLGMFKHEKTPLKTSAAEIHQLGKTIADSLKP